MSASSTIRVAIAGLGTVGSSTVQQLQNFAPTLTARAGRAIEVVAVSARDASKDRGFSMDGIRWEESPMALASADDVDVVVELIGGSEGIAKDVCEAAIANGKHVVTANKAMIAEHGLEMTRQAEKAGVALCFEAAVTGAIPILGAVRSGLAANKINSLKGIMNGTCNFILTAMEKSRRPFEEILVQAQELGYAEADPSFDIDGVDTAHKLAILTALAFGVEPNFSAIHVEGIRNITPTDIEYAETLGYRIKLLGLAYQTEAGIEQRVHPCLIEAEQPMARIPAAYNAVEAEADAAGKMFFEGKGAGGMPTASAVIADIVEIARSGAGHGAPFGVTSVELRPHQAISIDERHGSNYVRFTVVDRPGVLSAISTIFYKENISIKSCLQHSHSPGDPVPIVVITHDTSEAAMNAALARVRELDFIVNEPAMIRIEEL